MSFYDELSPVYDQMISFESRFESEKKIMQRLLNRFPVQTILDGGCGSGYHSIMLSSLGTQVTGFDPSQEMIKRAQHNSEKIKTKIKFIQSDFLNFPQIIKNTFDAIFTLGNSFVHLLNPEDILKTLKNFHGSLNSSGYVCIGIINYDKVLKNREAEISKKEKDGIIFHRYYSFNKSTISFHVDLSGKKQKQFTTELYPLTSGELKSLAKQAGFKRVKFYGNLKLNLYEKSRSDNIVAIFKL